MKHPVLVAVVSAALGGAGVSSGLTLFAIAIMTVLTLWAAYVLIRKVTSIEVKVEELITIVVRSADPE